jgi:hypothetical protein
MVSQYSTALASRLCHTVRYLDGIPRIDERTDLHGIDLWTGCEPYLNSLTVSLCGATPPLASDEDVPLGIFPSTATHQSMRFNGLADKRSHHGIKGIVREVVHNLETHLESQFLKFTYVQLLAQAFSHQALTRYG